MQADAAATSIRLFTPARQTMPSLRAPDRRSSSPTRPRRRPRASSAAFAARSASVSRPGPRSVLPADARDPEDPAHRLPAPSPRPDGLIAHFAAPASAPRSSLFTRSCLVRSLLPLQHSLPSFTFPQISSCALTCRSLAFDSVALLRYLQCTINGHKSDVQYRQLLVQSRRRDHAQRQQS